ncbi:MAG: S-layer homology domain-containing protein [Bacillota bacterium]
MKKIFGLLMTIGAVATTAVGVMANTGSITEFTDTKTHWANSSITRFADEEIVSGHQGEFRPDSTITRGEIATILDRIMQYQVVSENTFDDLDEAFYKEPLLKANASNIILGNGTSINPLGNATREEAVTILARAMHFDLRTTATETNFSDDSEISDWAKPSVAYLNEQGIINGKTATIFDPKSSITRAEFVTILDQAIATLVSASTTLEEDIAGNVVISSRDVKLQNMEIDGDLILAEGIGEGDIYVDNVTIKGNITIKGGGENSVYFNEVVVDGFVIIEKEYGAVRVVTSGVDGITRIEISGDVIINSENAVGTSMTEIVINGGENIVLVGDFGEITNNKEDVAIQIIGTVESFTMNADANINGNDIVEGDHQSAVPTEPSTSTDSTGGSSSSGSSGGSTDSSGSTVKTYSITIDSTIANGTVTTDKTSAPFGGVVTIKTTPDTGYALTKLTATNSYGNPMTITDNQFTMSIADVVVSAEFTKTSSETLNIQPYIGIVNGTVSVDKATASVGETVTVKATPADSYQLVELYYLNGTEKVDIPTINNFGSFLMPDQQVILYATFAMHSSTMYSITIDSTIANGTVTTDKVSAPFGDIITITATPDADYVLTKLSAINDFGNPLTITNNQFTMSLSNVVVSAEFSEVSATPYTVSAYNDIENGILSIDKATANVGETVIVTAVPDSLYQLSELYYLNGTEKIAIPVSSNVGTFLMPSQNVVVYATFTELPVTAEYTITMASGLQNGTMQVVKKDVSGNLVSTSSANYEDLIFVILTPDQDYVVDELYYMLNDNKVEIDNSFVATTGELYMPKGNITVYATFVKATPTGNAITIDSGIVNGSITSSLSAAAEDTTVTITASPIANYELISLYYEMNSQNVAIPFSGNTGTFKMPDGAITVFAEFGIISLTGEYNITLNVSTGGTAKALDGDSGTTSKPTITVATTGQTVLISTTADANYEVTKIYYMLNGVEVDVLDVGWSQGEFQMPQAHIEVFVVFEEKAAAAYTITADPTIENGTISFSSNTADAGTIVKVYATAADGYSVSTSTDDYSYTYSGGTDNLKIVTGVAPYFYMPEGDVVVYVRFLD